MERNYTKGRWVIATTRLFDDDQQLDKWMVGRFLRYDGPLLIVDCSGHHIAVKASDVIFLDAQEVGFTK